MPFGDGRIVAQFAPNLDNIKNLTNSFSFMNNFDFASAPDKLADGKKVFVDIIHDFGASNKPDLTSGRAYFVANMFTNPDKFASCQDPNFLLDSFVPSNNQDPLYAKCLAPSGNKAGAAECANNFNPKGGSCYGCLDIS